MPAKDYHGFKLSDIKRGQAYYRKRDMRRNVVRVMAVVDGYVVHRYKGCAPNLTFWKQFVLDYERTAGFDTPDRRSDKWTPRKRL